MDDREIARRAVRFQAEAREYRMHELPGYTEWAKRKLDQGEEVDFIMNIDDLVMTLLPEEVSEITETDYEELLVAQQDGRARSYREEP